VSGRPTPAPTASPTPELIIIIIGDGDERDIAEAEASTSSTKVEVVFPNADMATTDTTDFAGAVADTLVNTFKILRTNIYSITLQSGSVVVTVVFTNPPPANVTALDTATVEITLPDGTVFESEPVVLCTSGVSSSRSKYACPDGDPAANDSSSGDSDDSDNGTIIAVVIVVILVAAFVGGVLFLRKKRGEVGRSVPDYNYSKSGPNSRISLRRPQTVAETANPVYAVPDGSGAEMQAMYEDPDNTGRAVENPVYSSPAITRVRGSVHGSEQILPPTAVSPIGTGDGATEEDFC
jgi:hypothetical protein